MRICIDSSALIPGIRYTATAEARILDLLGPELSLIVPRLVAQEVTRNLINPQQVRQFYKLFQAFDFAFIIDEPVPPELVKKYSSLGLPEKADAFIGAFAEWLEIRYLISVNRHFLRDLKTDSFQVLTPDEFLIRWDADTL